MNLDLGVYKMMLDQISDGVYCVGLDGRLWYWNKAAEGITGYASSDVVGIACSDNLLVHVDDKGANLCQAGCPVTKTLADGQPREAEVFLHHKEGHRVPVAIKVEPIRDGEGKVVGAVEIFRDNSSRLAILQRLDDLEKLAFLDSLTNLANRRYIEMSLQSRLSEMERYGWSFGVLFADVDHFKQVNDRYGHEIGDQVLKMIATTMLRSARPFDVVGRWGGEEFLAIIANVSELQLYSMANRYRALVAQSYLPVDSDVLRVTISVGATVAHPGDTLTTLVRRADRLLYQSKTSGRNRVSTP